jgi:hypothetical protein
VKINFKSHVTVERNPEEHLTFSFLNIYFIKKYMFFRDFLILYQKKKKGKGVKNGECINLPMGILIASCAGSAAQPSPSLLPSPWYPSGQLHV